MIKFGLREIATNKIAEVRSTCCYIDGQIPDGCEAVEFDDLADRGTLVGGSYDEDGKFKGGTYTAPEAQTPVNSSELQALLDINASGLTGDFKTVVDYMQKKLQQKGKTE